MYMGGLSEKQKVKNEMHNSFSPFTCKFSFANLTGADFGASHTPVFQIRQWGSSQLVNLGASATCIEYTQSLECTKMPYPSDGTTFSTTVL